VVPLLHAQHACPAVRQNDVHIPPLQKDAPPPLREKVLPQRSQRLNGHRILGRVAQAYRTALWTAQKPEPYVVLRGETREEGSRSRGGRGLGAQASGSEFVDSGHELGGFKRPPAVSAEPPHPTHPHEGGGPCTRLTPDGESCAPVRVRFNSHCPLLPWRACATEESSWPPDTQGIVRAQEAGQCRQPVLHFLI